MCAAVCVASSANTPQQLLRLKKCVAVCVAKCTAECVAVHVAVRISACAAVCATLRVCVCMYVLIFCGVCEGV